MPVRIRVWVNQANDYRRAASVDEKIPHGITHWVVGLQPSKHALEVAETIYSGWFVNVATSGSTNECRDGGGNARDGTRTARELFNIDPGI